MKSLTNISTILVVFYVVLILGIITTARKTHASGSPTSCTVKALCPGDARTNGKPIYRYTGEDLYMRQNNSGGTTIFARQPDCTLPAGICDVTVRDEDGNTIKRYLTRGLDETNIGPLPQQQITKASPNGVNTPTYSAPRADSNFGADSNSILYSPTRVPGGFYDPFTNYELPTGQNEGPRINEDYYRSLYNEFSQPMPSVNDVSPPDQNPIKQNEELSNEPVRLEPGESPGERSGNLEVKAGNGVSTFVEPMGQLGERGVGEKEVDIRGGVTESNFTRQTDERYLTPGAVRGIPQIADASWVNDSRTPVIQEELRGNLARASDDLEYLHHLQRNDLCVTECLGEVVNRENQLRILQALNDEATRGYFRVETTPSSLVERNDGRIVSGPEQYLVPLQDARGETFYCTTSGTCSPSDNFQPAEPRRNPIALAAAPSQLQQQAAYLSYTGTPTSYALTQIAGSGANFAQNAFAQNPVFAPRPNYPSCSLLTSLIGACSNWQ